jgi:uncharacterized membrane protein YeiH
MTTDQILHVLYISVVIIGVITAVGGGTIRDLLLDAPVFWASDLSYIRFAVLASILTFIAQSFFAHPNVYKLMLYFDGLGNAMFGVSGAMKTLELGFRWPLGPFMLGVITAIGGGLIRDVLTGRKTLLMSDEVYAVPVAIGILTTLITFQLFPELKTEAILGGILIAFGLRSAAIFWEWRLPAWFTSGPK